MKQYIINKIRFNMNLFIKIDYQCSNFKRYTELLAVFITFIWRFPFYDTVLFFHGLQMYGKQAFDLQSLDAK